MSLTRRLAGALGVVAIGATGSACAPRAPAAPATPIASAGLCRAGTPAFAEAQRALAALSTRVDSVHEARGLAATEEALTQLLASPCFAQSAEQPRDFHTDSVIAFKTWWRDGGAFWVGSYLSAGDPHPQVALPPDVRASIAAEDVSGGAKARPLASFVCPTGDAACAGETRGWRLRSERYFARDSEDEASAPECDEPAKARDYVQWRICIEAARRLVPALPVGDLRAPRSGWLIVRAPSDRPACREASAYQMESGAAYRVELCGAETPRMLAGRVPQDNVREAAWMLLQADEVERVQVVAQMFFLPPGLVPVWPKGVGFGVERGATIIGSAHQAKVGWIWQDAERIVASGELTLPASKPGVDYAAALLAIVRAGFVDGAPGAPLPAPIAKQIGAP